ncbi:hypothetical protein AB0K00_52405 [Dactylosporangium sp. NPDC049525]|uniref:hypothetical protein n=1 Tax=Dactylosporangium sp. NPDC049525 TaxID=3154730 RepID=UPI003436AEFB
MDLLRVDEFGTGGMVENVAGCVAVTCGAIDQELRDMFGGESLVGQGRRAG